MALPNKLRGKNFVLCISPITCNSSACQYLQKMRNLLNYQWLFYAISCDLSTPHDIKNVKSRAPHRSAKPEGKIGQFFVSEQTRPKLKNVQKLNLFGRAIKEKNLLEGMKKSMLVLTWGYVWSKQQKINIFLSIESKGSEHFSKRYVCPMIAGHLW